MRPSILDPLFAPITSLEGVGPKVAGMIERIVPADLGDRAARAGDLLFTLPTSVIDRRDRPGIANAAPGAIVTLEVWIDRHQPPPRGNRSVPYRVFAHDDSGEIALTFFHAHAAYLEKQLPEGEQVLVSGRMEWFNGRASMVHPDHTTPADEAECRQMLSTGLQYKGPAAVRYPRGTGPGVAPGVDLSTLPVGKAQLRAQGHRLAILAFGSTVAAAEQAGRELGLSVVNMRFIKPLDRAMLLDLARTHEGFVTVEDNVVAGGAGSGVSELLNAEAILMPVLHLGLPDSFQHHASREDLLAEAGIDAAGIRDAILRRWPDLRNASAPMSATG